MNESSTKAGLYTSLLTSSSIILFTTHFLTVSSLATNEWCARRKPVSGHQNQWLTLEFQHVHLPNLAVWLVKQLTQCTHGFSSRFWTRMVLIASSERLHDAKFLSGGLFFSPPHPVMAWASALRFVTRGLKNAQTDSFLSRSFCAWKTNELGIISCLKWL